MQPVDEAVRREDEARTYGMLAHSCPCANVVAFAFAVAIVVFVALFATMGLGQKGHDMKSMPWEFFAYFSSFLAIGGSMFGLAVVGAFGARAAWLGRVFRYPFAIPFVRETATLS